MYAASIDITSWSSIYQDHAAHYSAASPNLPPDYITFSSSATTKTHTGISVDLWRRLSPLFQQRAHSLRSEPSQGLGCDLNAELVATLGSQPTVGSRVVSLNRRSLFETAVWSSVWQSSCRNIGSRGKQACCRIVTPRLFAKYKNLGFETSWFRPVKGTLALKRPLRRKNIRVAIFEAADLDTCTAKLTEEPWWRVNVRSSRCTERPCVPPQRTVNEGRCNRATWRQHSGGGDNVQWLMHYSSAIPLWLQWLNRQLC